MKKILSERSNQVMVPDNWMEIDIIIGVSIGIIIFFILLCGLRNCFCKSSDSPSRETNGFSLSVDNRVQNEEDTNVQPIYPVDSDQGFERTENL